MENLPNMSNFRPTGSQPPLSWDILCTCWLHLFCPLLQGPVPGWFLWESLFFTVVPWRAIALGVLNTWILLLTANLLTMLWHLSFCLLESLLEPMYFQVHFMCVCFIFPFIISNCSVEYSMVLRYGFWGLKPWSYISLAASQCSGPMKIYD